MKDRKLLIAGGLLLVVFLLFRNDPRTLAAQAAADAAANPDTF